MRSLLFSLFLLVTPALFANFNPDQSLETLYCSYLLNEDATPKSALEHLLILLGIPCESNLESIVAATQKCWLQTGKERWEFESMGEDKRDLLLPIFKQIGLVEGSHAQSAEYDYALVYGGFYSRMQKRIQHLVDEHKRGVRFKKVVLLTGQRYLDPNTEEGHLPFNTETEAMQSIWENTEMPSQMRALPVALIDTLRKVNPDGSLGRPGTKETLIAWLNTHPATGTCLFVSSQPFCGYQEAVAKTFLPIAFTIETIGTAAESSMAISIYLDNLARWLYQEEIRRGNNHGFAP